ncbi:MAG: sugar transporter substrate-binding protein [Phycisphaerales bacterium]|nr:sugar transporter substrate-binding protein [Phycisphaerales bacterium]
MSVISDKDGLRLPLEIPMNNSKFSVFGLLKPLLISVIGLAAVVGCKKEGGAAGANASSVTIGYLVKQPDEPWFQTEWQFAQKAADEKGAKLIKLAVPDGEKTLAAIDNLAASGAQGFVICTPDVRLGPAIAAKAAANNMKLITVDDQFLSDGKVMADVHHLGVAAREVGHVSGQALSDEMKKRNWPADQVAAAIVTFKELDTARERTEGIVEKLTELGFPKTKIYETAQKTTDIPGSFDAVNFLLTQHPEVKYWLVAGMNDTATLGGVRALEGRGFTDKTAIGIGINGTDCLDELKKTNPTPFFGSILMEANVHGHDTTVALIDWISKGTEPAKERFTGGVLITRADFEQKLKDHGMWR